MSMHKQMKEEISEREKEILPWEEEIDGVYKQAS